MYYKTFWYVLVMILGLYFASLLYPDITVTYHHCLNFLDCLFNGNLMNFYEYTVQNQYGGWPAVYSLPMYIIFGLWSLPLWILNKFGILDANTIIDILWAKLLVLFCWLGCCYIEKKLLILISCNDINFNLFQLCSSILFVVPALAISQYDCISLFFTLLGIYFCIKENKISLKVIVSFSVAVSLKMFAIFPFLFLILIKEKRVLHILLYVILGFGVQFLSTLPYIKDPSYNLAVSEFNDGMFSRLIYTMFDGGLVNFPIFFVCFFSVCIIAYMSNPVNKDDILLYLSWVCVLFYLCFFLFIQNAHPYWIILIVPFVIILLAKNDAKLKINYILEIAMELGFTVVNAYIFNWVFLTNTSFSFLFFKNIPVYHNLLQIDNFAQLVDISNLYDFLSVFYALFAVAGFALLFINQPWKIDRNSNIENFDENIITKKWLYVVRLICLISYFILSVLIYYVI